MKQLLKHLGTVIFCTVNLLSSADSTMGGCPISTCEVKDGCATVSVYVDRNKLKSGVDLEGTAMLRTARLLRKEFKELPKVFSVHSSIERADLNAETGIYTYISRYQVADIKEFIVAYKRQKAAEEKAAAERAAAERKAAEEKAAAERKAAEGKAAAERAAAERKASEEKAAAERAAAERKAAEEKAAAERAAAERKAAEEKAAAERAAAERKAAEEKAAAERAAAERKAAEEKAAAERAAAERKAAEEKAAAERAAAERKAAEEKATATSARNVFSEHGATVPIVVPAPEGGQPTRVQRESMQQNAASDAIKNLFN